ncbi:hypothetical protein PRUPE_3G130500 [Prunus persica]|uniref:Uncharacterized protein n=1 Tax=Prunus persica TaxID=3760 RepID=A0A251PZI4_PRUPE|nr:UPF0481 protein At3g47200 [Prunus persica]ONI16928.1 hypothetical protein PRUPE_3G130500 [Prunus persica]
MTTENNTSDHSAIESENDQEEEPVPIENDDTNENRDEDELLSSSIQEKVNQASDPFSVHRCIYRIPAVLRKHNEKAFVPIVVSIGPLHHGNENLQAMEEVKLWYLQCLLDRKPTPETDMESLLKAIRPIQQACQECYEEKIHISNDEFLEMMVIDGCFISEFFRRFANEVTVDNEDGLFSTSWMPLAVINDLLLLENQLPWRVLDCLFELTCESGTSSLLGLINSTFKAYTGGLSPKPSGTVKHRHLLDFIRNSFLGSYPESESDESARDSDTILSATELRKVGVKFKRGNEDDTMLNITFENGVMKIPPIIVFDENRESLFGNLIVYEQCQPRLGYQITSYVVLLDNLIKSTKDVDFLVEKGIMAKIWSRKEMLGFFKRLYNDTRLYKYFSYDELQTEVNAYCAGGWRKWKQILRRDYLKNPCSSSS